MVGGRGRGRLQKVRQHLLSFCGRGRLQKVRKHILSGGRQNAKGSPTYSEFFGKQNAKGPPTSYDFSLWDCIFRFLNLKCSTAENSSNSLDKLRNPTDLGADEDLGSFPLLCPRLSTVRHAAPGFRPATDPLRRTTGLLREPTGPLRRAPARSRRPHDRAVLWRRAAQRRHCRRECSGFRRIQETRVVWSASSSGSWCMSGRGTQRGPNRGGERPE